MNPNSRTAMFRRRATFAAPVLAFAALFTPDAWAYLDPGTGSILLQGLIAGIAAATTVVSLYWQKTKALWRSLFGRTPRDDGGDDPSGR
jgi:hypothetical protein